jgi:hypothetical protein
MPERYNQQGRQGMRSCKERNWLFKCILRVYFSHLVCKLSFVVLNLKLLQGNYEEFYFLGYNAV